ncbi:uncharacterized protein GIQ15_03258 [Arthroderma uncinatum]|uniref:uncharacterized protein n=1 Tax=Arthroderma uncinatum TaxID=74035 RepID=UPI00144AE7FC|nr:uncharacterized protein GIQ15_03258 [Arthroderma uncinatum]KAF3483934.1 hypothetical protein GIQ15_03258 [Arthroderma uncinatum]
MRFTTLLIVSIASLSTSFALPEAGIANNNCGYPNGNCYDNNCHGELSPNRITCTSENFIRGHTLDASVDTDVAATPEDAMKMAAMDVTAAAPTTTSAALATRAYLGNFC